MPTNANLWALPSTASGTVTLTLNGKALPSSEQPFLHELGELEPRTRYSVDFEFEGYFGVVHDALSFTTGDGPAAPDPGAAPGSVTPSLRSIDALPPLCAAVLLRDTCFDTGPAPEVAHAYQPSGSAKAWLLQRSAGGLTPMLWPAECGAPADYSAVSVNGRSCVTLSGIDAVGAVHEGQEDCTTLTTEGASCGLALPSGGHTSALWLSVLAGLGLRRRALRRSA